MHVISGGISCIIFIQSTGVPFDAEHILLTGLPLKVKACGYLKPDLWSGATSAVSYRFNVPWSSNGLNPSMDQSAVCGQHWRLHYSLIAATADPRCLSAPHPNKQAVRHWTQPCNVRWAAALNFHFQCLCLWERDVKKINRHSKNKRVRLWHWC